MAEATLCPCLLSLISGHRASIPSIPPAGLCDHSVSSSFCSSQGVPHSEHLSVANSYAAFRAAPASPSRVFKMLPCGITSSSFSSTARHSPDNHLHPLRGLPLPSVIPVHRTCLTHRIKSVMKRGRQAGGRTWRSTHRPGSLLKQGLGAASADGKFSNPMIETP